MVEFPGFTVCDAGDAEMEKSGEVAPLVLYVQVITSWVAVKPPVPAVKPTNAVFPPTVAGMLIGHDVVKVSAGTAVSVMVMLSVVPS